MSQQDVIKEFLIDAYEGLDQIDLDLVDLEKDPHDTERLQRTFRSIHTIKGVCGFLAFNRLESIAHSGENLLSKLRDGALVFNADIATALLRFVDATREILAHIESSGREPDVEYREVIADLQRLTAGAEPAAAAPSAPARTPAVAAPASPGAGTNTPPAPAVEQDDERRVPEDARRSGVSDSALRVDVGLLDKLMNLVGELVLARNQILQLTAGVSDNAVSGATQRLNLVTSELQEGVMKTRMQPIGNVWSKFPRIVRDIAAQCGKHVRLEMEGKETDLDKTIIEAIKDPLTHIVRNSVDHGIEAPKARIDKGKAAEGYIRLRAFHEGGQINIEISDDGAGIDPAKIRAAAVRRNVITQDSAARMSDHEAIRLIFQPGFSTAEKVSNLSGRGVGMDVVKTNIEKIGGQVDVQSRVGFGTVLKIKIPLTLAIIPALVITEGDGARYAIPQVNLLELVRVEREQVDSVIEHIKDAPFYRLRGNLLPLVYLERELGLQPSSTTSDAINIVVLKADDRQFGLVVHAINDTEEIVVKPLGKALKGVTVFAGAAIMGDGAVALILDVLGIAQRANVVSEVRNRMVSERNGQRADGDADGERQMLLLFSAAGNDRMAVPLSQVARLEEFPATVIERSGDRNVVQYRGQILPLVTLDGSVPTVGGDEPCHVIVFNGDKRYVGLVVDRIVDIVSEQVAVQGRLARHGVIGSAVIQQKVTDLVDVQHILGVADADGATRTAA